MQSLNRGFLSSMDGKLSLLDPNLAVKFEELREIEVQAVSG